MDKEQIGIPKLRFPGFTDTWEQRKLGEIMNVGSVKRIHQSDWKNEGVRFLRARDIVALSKNEEPADLLYIDDSKYYEYSKVSGKVQKGDLLVTGVGSIGVPMLIESNEPIYFKDGNIIWFKNNNSLDGNFFYYSFTSSNIQNFIRKSSGTGTVGTYTIDNGKKTPILIPREKDEQQKIGLFFQQFDSLITLHQRKLEHLKQQKNGLLQKMFPKNGESVPEVRFPGFTAPWEQRRLGEVVKITMGQSPSSRNYTENPSDYILVQGNADMKNGHVVPRVWTTQITKQAEKGDLILSVRAPVGDIGKTDYDIVIGRGVAAIKGNSFIFQLLTKMKLNGYWTRFSTGSTFESINSDNIKNAQIMIPNLKEQEKIGNTFSSIDSLITLQQRRIEHLELLKKGLLQQMFV